MNTATDTATQSEEPFDPLDLEAQGDAISPQTQAAVTQAKWHIPAFLGAVVLFAVGDTWVAVTSLGVASAFAVLAAIIGGYIIANLAHEWGHYLGARLAGAKAPLKSKPAVLAYDFDLENNSNDQFLAMSLGGTLGNIAAIVLIWVTIPLDEPHRMAFLAAAIGALAFVAPLEWPVMKHAREHKKPMEALKHGFGGGLPTFQRAAIIGVVVALISYWIM